MNFKFEIWNQRTKFCSNSILKNWLEINSNCLLFLISFQGLRIREKVIVQPSIHAYDQDTGINARLRYNIILGKYSSGF